METKAKAGRRGKKLKDEIVFISMAGSNFKWQGKTTTTIAAQALAFIAHENKFLPLKPKKKN